MNRIRADLHDTTMTSAPHSLLSTWAEQQGIPAAAFTDAGRLAVTFDTVRVHLADVRGRSVLVEARIADLPVAPVPRATVVEKALKTAAARLRASAVSLTTDEAAGALWLQRHVAADADTESLTSAVEDLVNEVELWRKVI